MFIEIERARIFTPNSGAAAERGVIEVDANLGFSRANVAFLNMLGFTSADLSRRSVFSITHPADIEAMERAHRQLISGDSEVRYEQRYVGKGGIQVPCVINMHCGNRDENGWPLWFRAFVSPIAIA
jgi:PAS domain S-box-containing protein